MMKVLDLVVHCCNRYLFLPIILCLSIEGQIHSQTETSVLLTKAIQETAVKLNISKEILDQMEIQLIYTQIDRDARNVPSLIHHKYQVNDSVYYYPASTIKMPTALVALEKFRQLDINHASVYTPMVFGAGHEPQQAFVQDSTSKSGLPSLAHLIKKIFLVSDNNAHNRLYEFCGQAYLNETLVSKNLDPIRIIHRIGIGGFDTLSNQYTNPVSIIHNDQLAYHQKEVKSKYEWEESQIYVKQVIRGLGYWDGEQVVHEPFDFTFKNYVPISTQQRILESIIFPELQSPKQQWQFTPEDYNMIYQFMSMLPGESDYPGYPDSTYYDSYVKFWMFGDSEEPMPKQIRVFNKVGYAYGFLTDVAYIVDFKENIEFMLTGCVHVNANEIYNDGEYEYEDIGIPFMAELGRQIYQIEQQRSREYKPDLSRFQFTY